MLNFMLPEFTEIFVAPFTIHVDTNANRCTQPCDVVLGLDDIIELGIMIDGENKTIIWENTSIPMKHASGVSPLNNEYPNPNPNIDDTAY